MSSKKNSSEPICLLLWRFLRPKELTSCSGKLKICPKLLLVNILRNCLTPGSKKILRIKCTVLLYILNALGDSIALGTVETTFSECCKNLEFYATCANVSALVPCCLSPQIRIYLRWNGMAQWTCSLPHSPSQLILRHTAGIFWRWILSFGAWFKWQLSNDDPGFLGPPKSEVGYRPDI